MAITFPEGGSRHRPARWRSGPAETIWFIGLSGHPRKVNCFFGERADGDWVFNFYTVNRQFIGFAAEAIACLRAKHAGVMSARLSRARLTADALHPNLLEEPELAQAAAREAVAACRTPGQPTRHALTRNQL